ncbi:UvrD-helicase domain-containing protein [Pseudalkalibacillus berkeleyi]|uniref:DNA 3'-5' helicase n=1 Tax=Pseudalkalibacillus berkeleyi TaxID=1069813 RepID=A0ABS9GXH9_9BACL|nr:UvrD-helicase domain-containing protein [Pseudalkalibacillus berkeleyi]MCF6137492.1 UvrD-helicase domain-containing protein [Pseudalkalibacillus berkeleyi]
MMKNAKWGMMMDFSSMSPFELGETNDKNAIPYLLEYLKEGKDQDKRLAASAIRKLSRSYNQASATAYKSLIHNLRSEKAQVRQYSLKAISSLSFKNIQVSPTHYSLVKDIADNDDQEYNRSMAQKMIEQWAEVLRDPKREIEDTDVSEAHFPTGATRKVIEKAELASTETTIELVREEEEDAYYFRALENTGIKLNKPQLEATRHFERAALVLAGAGSGKTRVLTSRAGYLLSLYGVNPKQILLLTFTKKAANEMKERLAKLPGITNKITRDLTMGTYHSIFLRMLRNQGEQRRILSNDKQKHIYIKVIMRDMGLKDDYEPESLLAILSDYKNNMMTVGDLPEKTPIEKEVKEILKRYETRKREGQWMDFDDILLDSYFLLKDHDSLLDRVQNQFSYVLCDEWQDTNPIQYELIKMIAKPQNNLFVVGDDDQTIYEFNGADSSIILNFGDDFPGTTVYHLDINYRSTSAIVGLANKLISVNQKRYKKTLQVAEENGLPPFFIRPDDVNSEAINIVERIMKEAEQGVRSYRDYAVLFRSHSNSRAIFDQLVLKDVPFVTFGDSNTFYEQSIVKPVLDYLRLIVNPKDIEAVRGVLPTLYLNREKATDFIMTREFADPSDHLLSHVMDLPNLKGYQKKQINERIRAIQSLKGKDPLQAVKKIRTFYDKYLEADERKHLTMQKEMILDTLSEIESAAKPFKSIVDFLQFVNEIIMKNKEMEQLRKDPNADVLKLMTIHKSKGLEFPVVYLIGASENILPHRSSLDADTRKDMVVKKDTQILKTAIESERRLAYVAITRAEEEICISSPKMYREQTTRVSRFIMDVFKDPTKQPTHSQNKRITNKKAKTKESLLVWDCTQDTCNAWKRLNPEEKQIDTKECPLCKGTMERRVREVSY